MKDSATVTLVVCDNKTIKFAPFTLVSLLVLAQTDGRFCIKTSLTSVVFFFYLHCLDVSLTCPVNSDQKTASLMVFMPFFFSD